MKSAISLISESFHVVDFAVWRNLADRLLLSVSPPNHESRFLPAPPLPPPPSIGSTIVSSLPSTFDKLFGKKFSLLYRGSRDGFGSEAFHERCDGHPETLTIVQTQTGYIFGGYTPLAWASGGGYIADDGVRSFIFTVKNPHGLSPRIFRLKQDMKQYSVWCTSGYGPTFGGGNDICIYNHCNTSNSNYVNLGHSYNNDTGMDGRTLLAGESNFTVQELEVFEPIG
jgi:hypothetical protein